MAECITSRDNAKIKYACKLAQSAAFRNQEKSFLAEGLKLCPELAKGCPLKVIYYTEKALAKSPELESLPGEHYLVQPHVAEKLAQVDSSQGVFAVFGMPEPGWETVASASAQKPRSVIDKMVQVYEQEYANVHRGSYLLSEEITSAYEEARKIVQKFLNAASPAEIVFTRNATESINLVASTWGRKFLTKIDEVIITEAEHHANLVPWQVLRDEIDKIIAEIEG